MKKAVCLLSGGLDSTTTLAIAQSEGLEIHALTFKYGQKAALEIAAAMDVCYHLKVAHHKIIELDLRQIGGSALTTEMAIPLQAPHPKKVPVTYVPARNTILLAMAVAYAETIDCNDIYIGVNARDFSGYPDCRPEFLKAFEQVANLGTRAGYEGRRFKINAPLLHLTKGEIIRWGLSLGVDYSRTISCYQPDEKGFACGLCESCRIRLNGFEEAGAVDPIQYSSLNKK